MAGISRVENADAATTPIAACSWCCADLTTDDETPAGIFICPCCRQVSRPRLISFGRHTPSQASDQPGSPTPGMSFGSANTGRFALPAP
jgi:hypothetical protein